MSLNGFKVPLQEQKNEINTPFNKTNNKITTPPESLPISKNYMVSHFGNTSIMVDVNDHINTNLAVDTPVKTYDINSRSLLLSPAFSSPQTTFFKHQNKNMKPYFNPTDHQNQPTVGFNDLEKTKKKKSKTKKSFDFQSNDKPPYSYATLIGLSILSHPDKRLTLSSIYQWISDSFKYYKKEDVGWQNSIRHNLSLNKAFVKGEKSKDGKGHFWCIQQGYEDQFLKLRSNKNGSYQEIMDQINQRKASINSLPSSPNYYEISNTTVDDEQPRNNQVLTSYNEEETDDESSNKRLKLDDPFVNSTPKQETRSLPSSFEFDNSTPKLIITDSPHNKPITASKNLTFTSSFSCNSNLELSPIRPNETGPLLEPLTPGRIYKPGAVNHHLSVNYQNTTLFSQHVPKTSSLQPETTSITNKMPSLVNYGHQRTNSAHKTPKAIAKTPLRILKTPQTSAKKFWHSPNYLDDFYYSPLVTSSSALHSYDDDDMILRAFESPANNLKRPFEKLHSRQLSNSLMNSVIDKDVR